MKSSYQKQETLEGLGCCLRLHFLPFLLSAEALKYKVQVLTSYTTRSLIEALGQLEKTSDKSSAFPLPYLAAYLVAD